MSDSEKLRRTQGNIWLTVAFIPFIIAICAIWLMFTTYYGFILMLFGTVPLLFFTLSIVVSTKSYETYIGVSEELIINSDSAKLRKINGICELVCAYVLLALAISSIWVIFVFAKDTLFLVVFVVLFCVFLGGFFGNVIVAVNDFMAIEKLVEK